METIRCEFCRQPKWRCSRNATVRGYFYDIFTEKDIQVCLCAQHAKMIPLMRKEKLNEKVSYRLCH